MCSADDASDPAPDPADENDGCSFIFGVCGIKRLLEGGFDVLLKLL